MIGVTDELDMPHILIGSGEKNDEEQRKKHNLTQLFNVQIPKLHIQISNFVKTDNQFT
jgi:hypothetical protein